MDSSGEIIDTPVTKLRLRSYQQEMLESSLEKNIIVAVGTFEQCLHTSKLSQNLNRWTQVLAKRT